jgi:hypothetical protein
VRDRIATNNPPALPTCSSTIPSGRGALPVREQGIRERMVKGERGLRPRSYVFGSSRAADQSRRHGRKRDKGRPGSIGVEQARSAGMATDGRGICWVAVKRSARPPGGPWAFVLHGRKNSSRCSIAEGKGAIRSRNVKIDQGRDRIAISAVHIAVSRAGPWGATFVPQLSGFSIRNPLAVL